jgi:hypothetical protein
LASALDRPEPDPSSASAHPRRTSIGEKIGLGMFAALAYLLFGLAIWQIIQRVPFKWDLYIWAESPFMTNMAKLDKGKALYSSPAEANSFVYSLSSTLDFGQVGWQIQGVVGHDRW